jgi:hypothetical protein
MKSYFRPSVGLLLAMGDALSHSPWAHVGSSPLPLFFPFSFFSSPSLTHAPSFSLSLLSPSSSHLLLCSPCAHTHSERERERERERESCCMEEEERRKKTRVLERSVQSASTAPIDDHPWSDEAEILQGGSQHVNLHCERWRSDLEQSAVVFLHVNSSSILE